jgi:hypothetical protein
MWAECYLQAKLERAEGEAAAPLANGGGGGERVARFDMVFRDLQLSELEADQELHDQFKLEYRQSVASALGLEIVNVRIAAMTAGSVRVETNVTLPLGGSEEEEEEEVEEEEVAGRLEEAWRSEDSAAEMFSDSDLLAGLGVFLDGAQGPPRFVRGQEGGGGEDEVRARLRLAEAELAKLRAELERCKVDLEVKNVELEGLWVDLGVKHSELEGLNLDLGLKDAEISRWALEAEGLQSLRAKLEGYGMSPDVILPA